MTILIVDDDPVQCRLLEGMLHKFEYETLTRDFGRGGARRCSPDPTAPASIASSSIWSCPISTGIGVLAKMRQAAINVPVIVQTAHGGIDNVVSAMRAGAVDFVVKPVGAERLHVSVRNALNASALEGELRA